MDGAPEGERRRRRSRSRDRDRRRRRSRSRDRKKSRDYHKDTENRRERDRPSRDEEITIKEEPQVEIKQEVFENNGEYENDYNNYNEMQNQGMQNYEGY